MKIQKKHLEVLFLAIRGTEGVLTLPEGRIRDAFMKPLTEATKDFEEDRKKIYEKFCNKNEDGIPDLSEDKYHFEKEVIGELNKELVTLYEEKVDLKIPDGLKEIIERTQWKPKVGEVEIIDSILDKIK